MEAELEQLAKYYINQKDYLRQKKRYGNGFKSNRKRVRRSLIRRDGNVCKMCGKTDEILTIDHVKRRNPGERQDNHIGNLQLLCVPCHQLKDKNLPRLKPLELKREG